VVQYQFPARHSSDDINPLLLEGLNINNLPDILGVSKRDRWPPPCVKTETGHGHIRE